MMPRVSSTDSVVWVSRRSFPLVDLQRRDLLDILDQ